MKRTVSRLGIAVVCGTLLAFPAAAQGTDSAANASPSQQHESSGQSGDTTDQKGSTHGDQIGAEGNRARPGDQATPDRGPEGTTGTAGEAGRKGVSDASAITDDRSFIVRAAAGSMAEVRFAHLAADTASNGQLKQFAQRLVEDHSKLNEELMAVARELDLTAPHAMRPEDKEKYERISKLSGEEFDRAFIEHMVRDHRQDLQLFRQHAQRAEHDRVKQFAQSTLPTLEQHYRRSQELHRQLAGGDTRGTSGNTDTDRLHQGTDDPERSETHVHDEEQGGAEEQPGTSTGTPPQ